MKDENKEELNLLELIPERNVDFEETADGMIVLLTPRFKNRFLVKYILPRLNRKNYRVDLDEIGSFVWKHCNGEMTAGEIAMRMKERFGDRIRPVNERLRLFFGKLERLSYIRFVNIEECRRNQAAGSPEEERGG
jgi:hypothetical protein